MVEPGTPLIVRVQYKEKVTASEIEKLKSWEKRRKMNAQVDSNVEGKWVDAQNSRMGGYLLAP